MCWWCVAGAVTRLRHQSKSQSPSNRLYDFEKSVCERIPVAGSALYTLYATTIDNIVGGHRKHWAGGGTSIQNQNTSYMMEANLPFEGHFF